LKITVNKTEHLCVWYVMRSVYMYVYYLRLTISSGFPGAVSRLDRRRGGCREAHTLWRCNCWLARSLGINKDWWWGDWQGCGGSWSHDCSESLQVTALFVLWEDSKGHQGKSLFDKFLIRLWRWIFFQV